MLTLHTS